MFFPLDLAILPVTNFMDCLKYADALDINFDKYKKFIHPTI